MDVPHSNQQDGQAEKDLENLLHELSYPQKYKKGQEIVIEGTDSNCLYYVQDGTVEVSQSIRGTKIAVALIGAGNFFGEIGFFDQISRVRDIRAIDDAAILTFDRNKVLRIQHEKPVLYGKFVTLMAQSICAKFRRVLEEREPLGAYATSLSAGRRSLRQAVPLPDWFYHSAEWTRIHELVAEIKATIFEFSYQLQQAPGPDISDQFVVQCHSMLTEFHEKLLDFQENSDPENATYAWEYVFKEMFPYFMRSRFAERAYYKPKGYAGDFLMMEMIYRNEPEGDGKLGKLIDGWSLNNPAAKAVRGRRKLLANLLAQLVSERTDRNGSQIRIMNLACGSNRELFDFLSQYDHSEILQILCVDADPEALEYTHREVNVFPHQAEIRLMNDNVVKWSLGRVRHNYGLQDIIYSAGLTDYLDDKLFQALVTRCYEYLKPGGSLIVGNFSPHNPSRAFMDHILDWKLIHRDRSDLQRLFAASPFGNNGNLEVMSEQEQVNLFAVATKPR